MNRYNNNYNYEDIKLEKSMYKDRNKSFSEILEERDPSENYEGCSLGRLDAYERQLKRFDIKVNKKNSDKVSKFFTTEESKILFPEYISRSINTGIEECTNLEYIVNQHIKIDSLSYKSLFLKYDKEKIDPLKEGDEIPEIKISLKEHGTKLKKIGRIVTCSYEFFNNEPIASFNTILKRVGIYLENVIFEDAIKTILEGDGNDNKIKEVSAKGKLTFQTIIDIISQLQPYNVTTILFGPKSLEKLLAIPEFTVQKQPLEFKGIGVLKNLLDAKIIFSTAIPEDKIIFMDKNYTINYITYNKDDEIDSDRVVEKQMYRYVITKTYGFSKIMDGACICLNTKG